MINLDSEINELLTKSPYILEDREKNQILTGILKIQLENAVENNTHIKNMFSKQGIDISSITKIEEIPQIPVQMFKYFNLSTCDSGNIVKILRSSGTTSDNTSMVPLNKKTVLKQMKSLKQILSDYMGNKRKIFLVIDHEGINNSVSEFSARTAGVRGLSIYAKDTYYLLKEENGKLTLNEPVIKEVIEKYSGKDVYAFGFTYIIWSVFYKQIIEKDISFAFNDILLFHSGGWKKLKEEKVSKEFFSEALSSVFNTDTGNILDFYGMAEQTGIIFVDCECGNKHVPNISQVIVRNPYSLQPCAVGEIGMIEILSILSDSYYSQAILTEDLGYVVGIDDCPCGRKGTYFRFSSRIEKAEIRGCGDTFKE
ncbi:LuxE/PaaK family acyltransferase [Methanogenium organophilum]|uniref:Acyl-protein synthetase n=1 Tax=Methanogenium organophilum TaxID=2199 RepID=A0A9X9S495_METOG|nr:acyl-protein synthetase [Methanogenium organophilum]WAI01207.1 acyl-protein synthetase [Methanogenium organophilum]